MPGKCWRLQNKLEISMSVNEPTKSLRPAPPRLRIHHLLAWMTVAAVLISACLWFDRTARNGPPIQSRTIVNSLMLGAIVIAGALTFTGFGLYWRTGIYAFPATPGELLLSIIARASM